MAEGNLHLRANIGSPCFPCAPMEAQIAKHRRELRRQPILPFADVVDIWAEADNVLGRTKVFGYRKSRWPITGPRNSHCCVVGRPIALTRAPSSKGKG